MNNGAIRFAGALRSLGAKLNDTPDGDLLAQFATRRDETAFATLVRRHGAMVQHVCRSLLQNRADADDAFQATFLVLARKATLIRKHGALGSWLYGVAYRTALKAKTARATRKRYEAHARADACADAAQERSWREAQWILHDELARLPEKYRAPLVLCYLEGRRQEDAERLLGWRPGKLRSMLERAREFLRKRLVRRGLGPSAVLLTAAGLGGAASASPPLGLIGATAHAATAVAGAATAAAGVSANVASLTEDVLRSFAAGKVKIALGGALLIAALGLGVGRSFDAADKPTLPDHDALSAAPARNAGTIGRTDATQTVSLPTLERAPIRMAKLTLSASDAWDEHTPDKAFDGTVHTMWNAGSYAPHWIEADLRAIEPIASIRLKTSQTPAGFTQHEIWVCDVPIGHERAGAKRVHAFEGHTDNNQELAFVFPKGLRARYVQIRTTNSPSWVGWQEIALRTIRADGEALYCRDTSVAPTVIRAPRAWQNALTIDPVPIVPGLSTPEWREIRLESTPSHRMDPFVHSVIKEK